MKISRTKLFPCFISCKCLIETSFTIWGISQHDIYGGRGGVGRQKTCITAVIIRVMDLPKMPPDRGKNNKTCHCSSITARLCISKSVLRFTPKLYMSKDSHQRLQMLCNTSPMHTSTMCNRSVLIPQLALASSFHISNDSSPCFQHHPNPKPP